MGIIAVVVGSILILCIILMICKYKNFSILPKDMQVLSKPKKFKMPKIRRDEQYKWHVEDSESSSDDDDTEDETSSEDDSDF